MSLEKNVPSTNSNVIFTGLDPEISYSVSVYATTTVGSGPSNVTVITSRIKPPSIFVFYVALYK